jgi:hypothetical protein
MDRMEVPGHIQNGHVVPDQPLGLPDGSEVTIVVPTPKDSDQSRMTAERRTRYLNALAQIDALENENPGDIFSGGDHDQALYGAGRSCSW